MEDFTLCLTTNYVFGRGVEEQVGKLTSALGSRALVCCGHSSARKSGVECIRIEKNCGIDPVKEKQKPQLTSDGTHTNNKGAWQIARCVYDYLAFSNPQ